MAWDVRDGQGWRRAEEVFLPWPAGFPAATADPLGDAVAETLMGFPTCAARTSAEPTRPTTGSPSCPSYDSFTGPTGQEGAGSVDQDTT